MCMSKSSVLPIITSLGEGFDNKVLKWKETLIPLQDKVTD